MAIVDGTPIARETFNREYRQTIDRYKRNPHPLKPALRERLKDNIVQRLVDEMIISQQAEKMGVVLNPEVIEAKWQEHKKRYGSEEALQAFAERAGTTIEDLRRDFENNHLREAVFRRIGDQVTVSAEEIREYFKANQGRFNDPEMVRASHILIRVPPDADDKVVREKRKLAQQVRAQAKKKGADFAALAKEFGEDPTKDRGGDLGYFPRRRMAKPIEEAAWALKKDQISKVIRTQFGFHILKKTDHRKAVNRKLDEVASQIHRTLIARKRNEAIRDRLKQWKDETNVEVFVKGDEEIINAQYNISPHRGVPMPRKGQLQPSTRPAEAKPDPSDL